MHVFMNLIWDKWALLHAKKRCALKLIFGHGRVDKTMLIYETGKVR